MRVLLFVAVLLPFSAFAQITEQERTAEIYCEDVTQIEPSSSDAAYKPGVDVHGNKVAPADLNSIINSLVEPIRIPIEVDLIESLGLDVPDGVKLDPEVAHIDIYKDGRIEYNGQDISNQVTYLCDKPIDQVEIPEKEHGQAANNPIPSAPVAQKPPQKITNDVIEGGAN